MCDIMLTIEKKNYSKTIDCCVCRYFYFSNLLLNIEVLRKRKNEYFNSAFVFFVVYCKPNIENNKINVT